MIKGISPNGKEFDAEKAYEKGLISEDEMLEAIRQGNRERLIPEEMAILVELIKDVITDSRKSGVDRPDLEKILEKLE